MSQIEELITAINTEINNFEQRHIQENKYKPEQQEYLTKLRSILSSNQTAILKREALLQFFKQYSNFKLIYSGLWKLDKKLINICKQNMYSERRLYLDELSGLQNKVAELSEQLQLVTQQLASTQQTQSTQVAKELLAELSKGNNQESRDEVLTLLATELQSQQKLVANQQQQLRHKDQAIQKLELQLQSLELKNDKLFQSNQQLIMDRIEGDKTDLPISTNNKVQAEQFNNMLHTTSI